MSSFFFENHSMLLIAACFITETCPCKMQRFVSAVKNKNFIGKLLIVFIILFKTLIWVHVRIASPRQF